MVTTKDLKWHRTIQTGKKVVFEMTRTASKETWTGVDCFYQTITPLISSCPASIRYAPSDRSGRATVALYQLISSAFVVGITSCKIWKMSLYQGLYNPTRGQLCGSKTFTFHWTPYGRAAFSLRILTQRKRKLHGCKSKRIRNLCISSTFFWIFLDVQNLKCTISWFPLVEWSSMIFNW